ncbi:MAG: UvrD-helicase domain-containing protein [Deltaproteobacteria bacterium]|nr:UvrD-helicase domain-containing protein [Deltaproteobacteria bacterium]
MTADELRKLLNPPQLEAVLTSEGPLLVFAGAGSGKTRVITYRAAHLVQAKQVAPWRVMCVTFTNKAAGEMRARLANTMGERARDLWIATFHATGAKLLRRYHEHVGLSSNFAIYDDSDQRAVVNRVLEDRGLDDKQITAKDVMSVIDRAKQEMRSPLDLAEAAETERDARIAEVYANYEHRLHGANAVDFGDLLYKLATLLERDEFVRTELQTRFQYVMVDEFQDTNTTQYAIVRRLVGPHNNLCVVGDDDQAIYRWRGADVRNIQYFTRDYPGAKIVKLEQNYRSTGNILKAANAVIARLGRREKKELFTQQGDGPRVDLWSCRDEREESQRIADGVRGALRAGIARKEIAIFYRIHAQSRPIEEALRVANIPYVVVGGQRFFERAEVKDILAYMRLAQNPNDDVSFLRVVNTPARGIGKTSLDRLTTHARGKESSLWKLIASGDYPSDLPGAARNRLKDFWTLISEVRRVSLGNPRSPADLAVECIERSGYKAMLDADKGHESQARWENLQELVGSMRDYERETAEPTLTEYLERVTLDQGDMQEETDESGRRDNVSLMSVHGAKGLEFDQVFLTGMEDGMFPYKGMNPGADPEEMDEERRLAYVAITRARKRLTISHATFRQIFGQTKVQPPSRFILEIPDEVLSTPVRRPRVGPAVASPSRDETRGASQGREGVRVVYDREESPRPESFGEEVRARAGHDDAVGFRKGMRVKHAKFGIGKIEQVEAGSDVRLTIYFPNLGLSKRVLADFVQPLT